MRELIFIHCSHGLCEASLRLLNAFLLSLGSGLKRDTGHLTKMHEAPHHSPDAPLESLVFLEALQLPALIVSPDGRIAAANSKAGELLGAALTGFPYVSALRQPDLVKAVANALEGAGTQEGRYLSQTAAQSAIYRTDVSPLGDTGGVLLSFQDISHLEQAGQMRRDFVANVSHELRTPLTALMGFIETLQGPAKDDTTTRIAFLDIMAQEAARMERLVSDLLSLSRVESEERRPPQGSVEIGGLIRSVLGALEPVANDASVSLQAKLPETALTLRADPDQIRQVLSNLIENAIKYGGKGGQVTVSAEVTGPQAALRGQNGVRISVRDTGAGIDPLHIPRLTERFYRVDSHRARQVGGTGLGLAIVKHIVQRHRGRMKIESELGEGSVFSVLLPFESQE
ncbi:ATP-binding protein [Lentibacter sp. XHP0401]|uniref:ATP-binding protein n=1 Tax=Lentibacter sp. XHP0401 TaxID=2984334 RepID=UPI002982AFB9|nr:ATP-binding protein [Lentibacter sp. XHP0401]